MIRLLFILFLLTGCASQFGQDWSKADTARQATLTALQIIDWRQTREIASNPDDYYELNPLISKHPSADEVDRYMITSLTVKTIIAPSLQPTYRKWFQYAIIGLSTICVINNYSVGLTGEF